MPYTKEELSKIGFYNVFIDKLRSTYISELIGRAKAKFRDENNVFYSFEDIDSTLGIEDVQLTNNSNYTTLETELNRTEIEPLGYQAFQDLISGESASVQSTPMNKTKKDESSDNLINRFITELSMDEIIDPLPDNLQNGDMLTTDDPMDTRKWLIDGNQKRIYSDLQSFYAAEGDWTKVKTRTEEIIFSIPDGEPVD
jgi:hypothetical protein